jgi:hypothetical protein
MPPAAATANGVPKDTFAAERLCRPAAPPHRADKRREVVRYVKPEALDDVMKIEAFEALCAHWKYNILVLRKAAGACAVAPAA